MRWAIRTASGVEADASTSDPAEHVDGVVTRRDEVDA
jgi:hypothetical protein